MFAIAIAGPLAVFNEVFGGKPEKKSALSVRDGLSQYLYVA